MLRHFWTAWGPRFGLPCKTWITMEHLNGMMEHRLLSRNSESFSLINNAVPLFIRSPVFIYNCLFLLRCMLVMFSCIRPILSKSSTHSFSNPLLFLGAKQVHRRNRTTWSLVYLWVAFWIKQLLISRDLNIKAVECLNSLISQVNTEK